LDELEATLFPSEIRRLESELQKMENVLSRHESTELALQADISALCLQKPGMERTAEATTTALQSRQRDRDALLASINRYRGEMKQKMTTVVDPAERKKLEELRRENTAAESSYQDLARQLALTEVEKSQLKNLLELELEPGLAALKARLAASRDQESQLVRLRASLAAEEGKREGLLAVSQAGLRIRNKSS
jgi:hypothetical protein